MPPQAATRIQTDVRSEEISARKYPCGDCPRTAIAEVNGVLVVKSHHSGRSHTTALTVNALIRDYVSRAGPQQLQEIERVVTARIEELTGMGIARAKARF